MASAREINRHTSMDTPGVMFFRVTVMLSCLILVPAAAIFGSQFPQVVRQYLELPLRRLIGWEATATPPAWSKANAATSETAPAFVGNAATPPSTEPNSAPTAPQWQPPAQRQPVPHTADYSHNQHTTSGTRTTSVSGQVIGNSPAKGGPLPVNQAVAASHDRFTHIQHLLRLYGALNYRLESTGPHGELYQFSCQMPQLDGQPASFSVTNPDPLQAMDQVLHQVEAWRDRIVRAATSRH